MVNPRKATYRCQVGAVSIGGNAPVVVQSMTNTNTEDIKASVQQCLALSDAGSELIRLTVNTPEAAAAIPFIREALDKKDCFVPLIGDFHYNGHRLLQEDPACAKALAKYRINPGNVGFGAKKDEQFALMIELACRYDKPIRIGVNGGSLDQKLLARLMDDNVLLSKPKDNAAIMRDAMVASALESAAAAEKLGLAAEKIILSCKVSAVSDLIAIYRELSSRSHYPLHLGLTEAGMGTKGVVSSTAALAVLLAEGIGDTLRVSLTPPPGGARTEEVRVSQEILQSLGLRAFAPTVIACPGCGRTSSQFFQQLAEEIQNFIRDNLSVWREKHPGVENLTIAVMGCIVNGPGESKQANIGISLPGNGEIPQAPVYEDGIKTGVLKGDHLIEEFKAIIISYIQRKF